MIPTPGQPGPSAYGATDAEISSFVVRRFAFKCVGFTVWAALQALLGFGFSRQLAVMALISAVFAQCLGVWHREQVRAPHWTYFDEAAWFVLVGSALRMVAS